MAAHRQAWRLTGWLHTPDCLLVARLRGAGVGFKCFTAQADYGTPQNALLESCGDSCDSCNYEAPPSTVVTDPTTTTPTDCSSCNDEVTNVNERVDCFLFCTATSKVCGTAAAFERAACAHSTSTCASHTLLRRGRLV